MDIALRMDAPNMRASPNALSAVSKTGLNIILILKNMNNLEIGKKYLIKAGTPVFSVGLQKRITFCEDVVVEVKHTHLDQVYFGMLVDYSEFGADYETDNEIEFGADAVDSEYVKKNRGNLTDYFCAYECISFN